MVVAQEEIFGPVVYGDPLRGRARGGPARERRPVRPDGDGLDGRPGEGHRLAQRIKSGTVGINTPYSAFPGIPFGGYKQSGFGRELGLETLDLYLETKSVLTRRARGRATRSGSVEAPGCPGHPRGGSSGRRAVRDRRDAGRRFAPRRTPRTSSRPAGCARPGSRSRSTRPATPSAGAATARSGSARTSTRCPNGGRFDGVLGVVAAIEVAERHRRAARRRRLPRRGARLRRQPRAASRPASCPTPILELHVEQGPVLERADAPLGIVTAIVGQARGEVVFEGRADHAGTTPMDARADALVARGRVRAARVATPPATAPSRRSAGSRSSRARQRRARARDRSRSSARADDRELDALVAAIGFEPTYRAEPVGDERRAARGAARGGARTRPSSSPAPATTPAILAAAGVPTGMLFVRSLNGGVSHSPDELSSPEDIAAPSTSSRRALVRIAGDRDASAR